MYNNHITIDVIHESKGVNGCLPINKVGCVFIHLTNYVAICKICVSNLLCNLSFLSVVDLILKS